MRGLGICSVTRADGTRVEKQTEAWYIEYGDASVRWMRRKAGITREQAQDALRKAESDVLNEKNGLPVHKASELSCRRLGCAFWEDANPKRSRPVGTALHRSKAASRPPHSRWVAAAFFGGSPEGSGPDGLAVEAAMFGTD